MPDDAPEGAHEADANRDLWTRVSADYADEHAFRAWASNEITWGIFNIPETQLDVLGEVSGLDVAELGCGTAYFSAWLARRGARPVGVDLTPAQLTTARRCQEHFGLPFPLLEADAGHVPLRARRFDLVISECGASLWCDPARWVPEAARLLRLGGRLVFHTTSLLLTVCNLPVTGYNSTPVTANGSRSCAPRASPLMHSTSSTLRQAPAPTPTTSSRPPNGPGDGPSRRYGSRTWRHERLRARKRYLAAIDCI
jgi:SAM-dependent methyltransferase